MEREQATKFIYDLLRALIGLCHAYEGPDWQEPVTRLVDVFVDGLVVKG